MKRIIFTFLLVMLLSVSTSFASGYKTDKLDMAIGTYVGSYTITSTSQGKRGLTLTISKSGSQHYEAAFEFYGLPGRGKSPRGKYFMTVDYDTESDLYFLHGIEWVDQPFGYAFVDLKGKINNGIFEGDVHYSNDWKNSIGYFYVQK